jgi:hypothetical protein
MPRASTTPSLPEQLPVAILESNPHSCFLLTESLDFAYCNSSWDRFARENSGGEEVFASRVLSRNFLDFVPLDLKDFYAGLFAAARAGAQVMHHEYQCSSPADFRVFRMDIYPLQAGRGFAVINSLMVEHPHTQATLGPSDATYKNENGLIRMCSNCRRSSRVDNPDVWDWVPSHLDRHDVTHGICQLCLDYYYRAYQRHKPA